MPSTVLILGARGRFGLAAAKAFADAGWRVLGLVRPGAEVPTEVADDQRIAWIHADLEDTSVVAAAAVGAAVVVHALNPAYTNKAWKAQALAMTQSAARIAKALQATLMFMGNVYNFGKDMPDLLKESTPQRASTIKGQIRIAMEAHLRQNGVPTIVIRAGNFFGSGRGTLFDQAVVKEIQRGKVVYPSDKHVTTAWAYLPDLARTFVEVAAYRQSLTPFEVFHFAGNSMTGQQWLDALQPAAESHQWVQPGAHIRYSQLPWPIIRLGSLFVPTWAALLEMRYLWDTPHRLDNHKLVSLLGAEPCTPLPQAIAQTLADLGLTPHPDGGLVDVR